MGGGGVGEATGVVGGTETESRETNNRTGRAELFTSWKPWHRRPRRRDLQRTDRGKSSANRAHLVLLPPFPPKVEAEVMGGNTGSDAVLTRGQALPQLLSLFTILEDQGVQVSGTPDLELGDLLALGSGGLGLFGEDGVGADRGGVEEGLLDLGRCMVGETTPMRGGRLVECRTGD